MALWRVFVVPEEPAVPWQRVLGLINRLRGSPALEEGVYLNTGNVTGSVFPAASLLFRVPQQCPSQLENGERLQLTGQAGREAVGTPWSRAPPSASCVLGHPGGLGWAVGSALQGWTRPSARVPGRMLWKPTPSPRSVLVFNRDGSFPAGLSLRHARVRVLLEPPGSGNSQRLCWRAWAPTGRTGVGTASRAAPCYPSPARGKGSSLGTQAESRRWPRQ